MPKTGTVDRRHRVRRGARPAPRSRRWDVRYDTPDLIWSATHSGRDTRWQSREVNVCVFAEIVLLADLLERAAVVLEEQAVPC